MKKYSNNFSEFLHDKALAKKKQLRTRRKFGLEKFPEAPKFLGPERASRRFSGDKASALLLGET